MKYRNQLEKLFIKYPYFFYAYISLHYPLSASQIDYLKDDLFWSLIANNEKIDFTISLIEKYKNLLCRQSLGFNKTVNSKKEIMKYFRLKPRKYWLKIYGDINEMKDKDLDIDYYHPDNSYHKWTFEQIDVNLDKISWNHFSSNKLLKWDYEMLEKYQEYLWFGYPCDKKSYSTDGMELFNNESVPWTIATISLLGNQFLHKKYACENFVNNRTVSLNIYSIFNIDIFNNVILKFC